MAKDRWLQLNEEGRVVEEIDFDPTPHFPGMEYLKAKGKETIGWVLGADGKFSPPQTENPDNVERTEILLQLQRIDAQTVRAMRESILYQTGELKNRLEDLDAQAVALRDRLAQLS